MKKLGIVTALVVLPLLLVASGLAVTRGKDGGSFAARLNGYQEVPSISTTGRGTFAVRVSFEEDTIRYRLSYAALEGGNVLAAHIHFAERHVNGAVVAFLCGGGGKPACPPRGTVSGTITAADIVAVPAQGIAAGEIDEVIHAMRRGATYANVHTTTFPGGEIRGQILRGKHHGYVGSEDDLAEDDGGGGGEH